MITSPQRLDLPDQQIAYAEVGATGGDATALVLLHGGAVDCRMWSPQMTAFPERTVVAPDARGHGGSTDADAAHRLADDVVALLDGLGIERAVLVGISMGGGTAVDVALEHPDRVAALVVGGTGTSEPEFTDPWCLEAFAQWRYAEEQGDLDAWIRAFMRFTAGPARGQGDVDPNVWELVETMARETIANHLRVDSRGVPIPPTPPTPVTDTWRRLPTIAVPVLAVCGTQDGADHQAMSRRLARDVQRGAFVAVPGAHYPNLEAPDVFNGAVHNFLSRHHL